MNSGETQADPYADAYAREQAKDSAQRLKTFEEAIENIYFAVGCRVFPNGAYVAALVGALAQPLIYSGIDVQGPGGAADVATQAGLKLALIPGKCDFWKDHPEIVYELRKEAETAIP
jgi:hypothetical protein